MLFTSVVSLPPDHNGMPDTVTDDLNPAQRAVIDHGLLDSGFDVVLQMPTGAGKTWLAEHAIARQLARGYRAIYLTPLRALAREVASRWKVLFGDVVGVFTGEMTGRSQEAFVNARVLVMTPERLDACTRAWRSHWSWIPDASLVVVDEVHLLGDARRGARLEGALLRFRRLNPFARLLCLSATLGNRDEIAAWLGGVGFASDWRPVPVSWHRLTYRRATEKPGLLASCVASCARAGGQSLVFVQSRRRAETLASSLRTAGLAAGHHHAGMDAPARRALEDGFRDGTIRTLVSTGTLEMGVNLPARQVVLYDLQRFDGEDFVPLGINAAWQRAGRAGRRGLDPHGEVVLFVPAWDRSIPNYESGAFEPVTSGFANPAAVAEQVLAEVGSGLARTRAQLARALAGSLASSQGVLPALEPVIDSLLANGLLDERTGANAALTVTRRGRVAVRQLLQPATVLQMARAIARDDASNLTLLDFLLLAVATDDCEARIPVNFEDVDDLATDLAAERSWLLRAGPGEVRASLGPGGRRILSILKTAVVARAWTRSGDAASVADQHGCYPFEVVRIAEAAGRILAAATSLARVTVPSAVDDGVAPALDARGPGIASVADRLHALGAMVQHGIDEGIVTLTFVPGIGGLHARRLRQAGIADLEDLALASPSDLAGAPGISVKRATEWISVATDLVRRWSASSLRDTGPRVAVTGGANHDDPLRDADQYRIRRARDLVVRPRPGGYDVSGGLEPHRVERSARGDFACDCLDFAGGHQCKHVLAVLLHEGAPAREPASPDPLPPSGHTGIDLMALWFDREER